MRGTQGQTRTAAAGVKKGGGVKKPLKAGINTTGCWRTESSFEPR